MSFTNAQNETFQLLRGVNLDVEKGKITALVGGNGTGKTTLFNIISGFEKGYTGDVSDGRNNFNRLSAHRISLMGIRPFVPRWTVVKWPHPDGEYEVGI